MNPWIHESPTSTELPFTRPGTTTYATVNELHSLTPFYLPDLDRMKKHIRSSDLEAYLDEALPPEEMAQIELALRNNSEWVRKLAAINARRDAGVHSLGETWRRHRLTCPSREQLGSYLLGAIDPELDDYYRFHLEMVGCRYCQANLADLERLQAEEPQEVDTRRRKYFQSSAGYLR